MSLGLASPEPPRPPKSRRLAQVHELVKKLEPWGILLAVLAFGLDYTNRIEERTVRAWQLLTTQAPGNSGKIEALQYLNNPDGLFCVQRWRVCLIQLKAPTLLIGIDLSQLDNGTPEDPNDDPPGAYLINVDLHSASLEGAVLTGANLFSANLKGAYLAEVNLNGATLFDADLNWRG